MNTPTTRARMDVLATQCQEREMLTPVTGGVGTVSKPLRYFSTSPLHLDMLSGKLCFYIPFVFSLCYGDAHKHNYVV